MQAIFKCFRKRALQQLEKRDGRPERQHRVRVRSSRRRTREFVFQGETVLPIVLALLMEMLVVTVRSVCP
jgi:hypothetical protein